jgi:hypothetical protein
MLRILAPRAQRFLAERARAAMAVRLARLISELCLRPKPLLEARGAHNVAVIGLSTSQQLVFAIQQLAS